MATDILLVSLGTTAGWRGAERQLAAAVERAGATVATVHAGPVPQVRTFMATDLVQARACRAAALRGIAEHAPRGVIYASSTAALLGPRPGAIWFDAPAAGNRLGHDGLWQRPLERRRMAAAPLLLPMSAESLAPLPAAVRAATPAVVLPVPVEPSGSQQDERDIAAIAYAADRVKKGSTGSSPPGRRRGDRARRCSSRVRAGRSARAPRGLGCWRRRSTARCCGGRACSSPRRCARTMGSPSWRRSPTAAGS